MNTPVITRFAPSPTGAMHLGNARTALFNWLLARAAGGRFVLRLEDTDQERSTPELAEALLDDLRWLGLEWDAGPRAEDEHGPYAQSERGGVYAGYYEKLEEAGKAYPCYCTSEELEAVRRAQRARGEPPRYPGRCRNLTAEDRARLEGEGRKATLRFRVESGEIAFDDLVRGRQTFHGEEIGDFIIRRSDGTPSFFFVNAVDDALMGVSRVLRGEDHLTNTPRQLLILEELGLPAPTYGHINLMVGDDGAPLSKRNGSRSVAELREAGYFPEAVSNYLARLGHHMEEGDLLALDDLAAQFNAGGLSRSPAKFDVEQLDHWNKEAVHHAEPERLWPWVAPALETAVPEEVRQAWVAAVQPNLERPADAEQWARACFGAVENSADAVAEIAGADPALWQGAETALEEHGTDFAAALESIKQSTGLKGKKLFKPLRAALTGRTAGPELGPLLPLMGVERALARIRAAKNGG
ncbi:glutamate--tRNA ligase [Thiohalorhabdus methylotrophus]|uniref:Glutamate--tRNA ligase n=1 Tax=Thiohalorhabdus methylotrophus TaxID=3242694 RepID=A0ABV4TZ15_9GAMM